MGSSGFHVSKLKKKIKKMEELNVSGGCSLSPSALRSSAKPKQALGVREKDDGMAKVLLTTTLLPSRNVG